MINAVSDDTQSLTKGSVYSWTLLQHWFMQHLIYSAKHPDVPFSSSEGTCCTVLLHVTYMWAPTSYQCHANHGSNISSQDQHHFESSTTCVLERVNPFAHSGRYTHSRHQNGHINTLRTGDTDLHFYITTVQDGWRKSAFLTRTWFPCTIYLIMQYMEPVSEWSCWRMFIETWPHSELNPGNVHLNNLKAQSSMC